MVVSEKYKSPVKLRDGSTFVSLTCEKTPNAHVTRNFLFVNDVELVTQPVQEIAGYRGGLVEVRRPHHQCMLYSATFHLGEGDLAMLVK